MGLSVGTMIAGWDATRHWEGWKDYWKERLAFLDNYKKIYGGNKSYPRWTDSDVDEFIASDPVYGPQEKASTKPFRSHVASIIVIGCDGNLDNNNQLKSAREGTKIAAIGSAIGAISTGGIAWKYSKSPHGALLSFGAGAVFGWTFGQEIANHSMQLYRTDTMAAQLKFLDWYEMKMEGRS